MYSALEHTPSIPFLSCFDTASRGPLGPQRPPKTILLLQTGSRVISTHTLQMQKPEATTTGFHIRSDHPMAT